MKRKKLNRGTFWWTVLIVLFAVCIMDLALWYALDLMGGVMSPLITSDPGQAEVTAAIQAFHSLERLFYLYGMPSSFVLFLMVVGFIRIVYRPGRVVKEAPPEKSSKQTGKEASKEEKARRRVLDQKIFLYMISVLQREGRLIDFFAEDLDDYGDDQIGAAVREIHTTCRRVVEKSLSLKPVINSLEGETVTIEEGFDPGTIKLVGNVSGDPPFSGILRHRGWQAGTLEIPTFPGDQDPGIIAPAEVEIQ
jgi:hypothetical protein